MPSSDGGPGAQARAKAGGSGRLDGHNLPLAILPVGEFSGGDAAAMAMGVTETHVSAARQRATGRGANPNASPVGHANRAHTLGGARGHKNTEVAEHAAVGSGLARDLTAAGTGDGGGADKTSGEALSTPEASTDTSKHTEWALTSLPAGSFGIVPNAAQGTMAAVPFRFLPPNQVRL